MKRPGLCLLAVLWACSPSAAQNLYVELQLTPLLNQSAEEIISAERILGMGLFLDRDVPIETYALDLDGDGRNEHVIVGRMANIPHGLGLNRKIVLVDSAGDILLSEMGSSTPRIFVDREQAKVAVMVERFAGPRLISIDLPPSF